MATARAAIELDPSTRASADESLHIEASAERTADVEIRTPGETTEMASLSNRPARVKRKRAKSKEAAPLSRQKEPGAEPRVETAPERALQRCAMAAKARGKRSPRSRRWPSSHQKRRLVRAPLWLLYGVVTPALLVNFYEKTRLPARLVSCVGAVVELSEIET